MNLNCWLWPDRNIGKRESRRLREEHNQLINDTIDFMERCKHVLEGLEPTAARIDLVNDITKTLGY